MMAADSSGHHFKHLIEPLKDNPEKKFFNVTKLGNSKYDTLPYSIRVLFEAAVRNCDGFLVNEKDVRNILDWKIQQNHVEVPFCPSRVLLQDFTGIPAVVDFAAMREAVKKLGGDPTKVSPACPTDLIVDHSLQIDFSKCAIQNAPNPGGGEGSRASTAKPSPVKVHPRKAHCGGHSSCKQSCSKGETGSISGSRSAQIENTPVLCPFHLQPLPEPETMLKNQELEFGRNKERLQFFKWGSKVFQNINIIPPGSGVVHQVNLEYLSRVVFDVDGILYPDSVVGTDSHTTMINGLGILGWGVGGIESETVMLGQPVMLTLPEVVGCKLIGSSCSLATSIDVVLSITKVNSIRINPLLYSSKCLPGFEEGRLESLEAYLKAVKLFRNYTSSMEDPAYSQVIEINLSSIVPQVSGPKRSQDRVAVTDMKRDFQNCLNEKVGFKGFQISPDRQKDVVPIQLEGNEYKLSHGSVVIAAVISCTNNCNPSVMLAAGLLAKNAVEAGLGVQPYIRTSLSPRSGMVTHYLGASGVLPYLSKLGFEVIGYGCATCVGNTAPLPEAIGNAIKKGDLIACGVLSGNKNFEGRLCDCVRANYLACPPLVVAYAIAGTVNIDFQAEPLGINSDGKEIYLSDIWPSRDEIQQVEEQYVIPSMFKGLKEKLEKENKRWNSLEAPESVVFPWDSRSTYIRCPSFFNKLTKDPVPLQSITDAHVLLYLGDSVTTDHISPAGSIARNSAAARYLVNKGLTPREFNSYGARRGNDLVMTRGTFANIKLCNKFIGKPAPKTIHFPSGQMLDVFDAAERYQRDGIPLIILAGKKYGSGSSRDWAAKGPYLLGVKAVIAESYEKIHRNHLVGMGIVPLQFLPGENADTFGLTGKERYSVSIPPELSPEMKLDVKMSTGKAFKVITRLESDMEVTFYKHGGILNYVARKML
nr:PREDICTED: iron-responsive element-binding protein 2 [Latimeria chalumnae]|eukprot:XP_014353843.1 PREDICTED: iron-responsive element-binding protein 2 [Latimeria chalumnae]